MKESLQTVLEAIRPKMATINAMDAHLSATIQRVEKTLHEYRIRRLVTAPIASGVELAWSGRGDAWRFVVRDGDSVTRLLDLSRAERLEAFTSGALEKIVHQVTRA